ncbi:twin-arginine translocation signal domain-containing protein [Ensifer sp. NM-2]
MPDLSTFLTRRNVLTAAGATAAAAAIPAGR